MSQDLYSSRVLELAADIPLVGLLESPDGRSHRVSRLCGSEIELDVRLQDGQVIAVPMDRLDIEDQEFLKSFSGSTSK